ncbi:MAG TPA: FeoA family protein [Caulifigura sp.]|jgi:ferrous iron transport protein A|nr:FeoA family protein [Caulifigura sp.]
MTTTLDQIPVGNSARIAHVQGDDGVSVRLMEMGLIDGVPVKVVGAAPFGGPREYLIRGFRLSLRSTEASRVAVSPL